MLPTPNFGSPNLYYIKHIKIVPHSMLCGFGFVLWVVCVWCFFFFLLKIPRGFLELLPRISSFNCPSLMIFSMFLAAVGSLQDLSFWIRVRTQPLGSESVEY